MNIISKERKEYIKLILKYHSKSTTSDINKDIVFNEGDLVDSEITKELIDSTIKQIMKVFNCSYRKKKIKKFYFEFSCFYCNDTIVKELVLDDFIKEYVGKEKHPIYYVCSNCSKELNNKLSAKFEEVKRKEDYNNKKCSKSPNELINNCIEYYTTPTPKEIDSIQKELYDILFERFILNWTPKIYERINSLSYEDFLKTPYWEYIRQIKLRQTEHKCEKCGSMKRLQVHHETYKHHGEEHLYLDDLSVLCYDCHMEIHHNCGIKSDKCVYLIAVNKSWEIKSEYIAFKTQELALAHIKIDYYKEASKYSFEKDMPILNEFDDNIYEIIYNQSGNKAHYEIVKINLYGLI